MNKGEILEKQKFTLSDRVAKAPLKAGIVLILFFLLILFPFIILFYLIPGKITEILHPLFFIIAFFIPILLLIVILLINFYKVKKRARKAELLLDEQGLSITPAPGLTVAFADVEEIVITRDKQGELISINLVGTRDQLAGLGGWNQMETILDFIVKHLKRDTLRVDQKGFFNINKSPFKSMIIALLIVLAGMIGFGLLAVLLIMGLEAIGFSLTEMSPQIRLFITGAALICSFVYYVFKKKIKKFIRQKRKEKAALGSHKKYSLI